MLVALACVALASAQDVKTATPLARVTTVLRDYARGLTENRFEVKSKISSYDASGKLQKVKNSGHTLEFTKGRYRSADPIDWASSMQIRGKRDTIGLEANTDSALLFPVFIFAPKSDANWTFENSERPDTKSIEAAYRPSQPCSTFVGSKDGFEFNDKICAAGKEVIDQSATTLLRSSFDALGLPLISPSGKTRLEAFHMDAEFQTVSVPGDKQPFSFPKTAISTYTYGDKKVVIESTYTLLRGGKR
jgi:hypothetical protein